MFRLVVITITTGFWATGPYPLGGKVLEVMTGGEEITAPYYPSLENLSPGDSIGWTYYDCQHCGNIRQMVWFDKLG
ncbi:MAG TPA: hypothetical protein EYP24_00735, partial [bacterium (Candidatus Stahlbacteria)]|nr:hypothetical protein [Candidatus Stahlbacteria bacterium]